jgi:hypothetical protein
MDGSVNDDRRFQGMVVAGLFENTQNSRFAPRTPGWQPARVGWSLRCNCLLKHRIVGATDIFVLLQEDVGHVGGNVDRVKGDGVQNVEAIASGMHYFGHCRQIGLLDLALRRPTLDCSHRAQHGSGSFGSKKKMLTRKYSS